MSKKLDILVELELLAKTYDNPIKCAVKDAAKEIKRLRKDEKRINWLASTEQNLGNVMLPRESVERGMLGGLREMIDITMDMAANAEVSGAGTASAGTQGYASGGGKDEA